MKYGKESLLVKDVELILEAIKILKKNWAENQHQIHFLERKLKKALEHQEDWENQTGFNK